MRFKGEAIGDVDGGRKKVLYELRDRDIAINIHLNVGRDFNHDVYIAAGPVFAADARAEQGGMGNALCADATTTCSANAPS